MLRLVLLGVLVLAAGVFIVAIALAKAVARLGD
jgi:hypothetical protein